MWGVTATFEHKDYVSAVLKSYADDIDYRFMSLVTWMMNAKSHNR